MLTILPSLLFKMAATIHHFVTFSLDFTLFNFYAILFTKLTENTRYFLMNKVAFITGATGGIGRAVAHRLAASGYDLILISRNKKEQLDLLCQELSSYSIKTYDYLCDLSDYNQVEQLFVSISSLPIDVLVNNAGISYIGLLQDMTVQDWDMVLRTNLSSCFYTSKLTIPKMLATGHGKIINISSVWGNVGASMEVAYSASKGGMNSFTKALAKELAPSGIQVNAIACGVIDTPMNHCFSEEERNCLREEIPTDRFGTPEEVAHLVSQLAESPEYMTGQIITLDGGWY